MPSSASSWERIAALNATFFHAVDATAKRNAVTEDDLKDQLHILCNMLGELEASEATDKELEQTEVDALKAEVATLREEVDKCQLEEKKKLDENTTKEKAAAPAPAAAEPAEDFDCDAGLANWKLGWSQPKKDHCCQTKHVGCEFDCDAALSNWKTAWSDKKKEYCCEEAKKGCKEDELLADEKEAEEKVIVEEKKNGSFNATGAVPANATEPFDCDAGLANWEKGWSDPKKEWCCKEKSMGCPFDCDAGVDNWEQGWADDKKEFCCEHTNVGCKFDCDAGFPKWETGWSEEKKAWCCVNKQTPTCPEEAEPNASVSSTTEQLESEEAPAGGAVPGALNPAPAPALEEEAAPPSPVEDGEPQEAQKIEDQQETKLDEPQQEESPPEAPDEIEPPMPEHAARTVGEWDRPDHASRPQKESSFDVDGDMPYGDLEPFGREDTAQELTEASIKESDEMVDQLERAEVAEEKRAVFRALTRLRGAAITSFDGIARSQTGNIDEYNTQNRWRETHALHHLADEESDVNKWAFPEDKDCD